MDAFEKRAGQVTNLTIGERAIANRMPRTRVAPFAVRRKDSDKTLKIGGVMIKPGCIGASERLIDVEAEVAGAPGIVKADIEKVRTQPQLENDADCVELVETIIVSRSSFDALEE